MSFYTARDITLNLQDFNIFANSASLSQEASLSSPYQEGEVVNNRNMADGPIRNSLQINYWLTGKDYLRDHIFVNHKKPLSGSLGGMKFSNAFLESYSLNAEPNSPISISVGLVICDEISGTFSSNSPATPTSNLSVCNFNDARFSTYGNYSFTTLDNITNFNWSFRANVEPIYYQAESGKSRINPDRVCISEKTIECSITSDNTNLETAFTGNNYALDLICYHPTNNSIYETYTISGKVNKKDFSISTDSLSQSIYSIRQASLNEEPKIGSITTSSYPAQNYITIQSPNSANGYFTSNNNYSLVEKVILGDRELKFNVWRGPSYDVITGYIPVDAINGSLNVHTTKGLMLYPTQVSLNFSGIGVSGFWPETGNYHDTILISGSNFHRVTNVLFNGVPANFNVYDTTGNFHKLIANVPDNITVGKINVISSLRNVSGLSTGSFYPMIEITGFTPTGTWSGTCIIAGKNFSGITNVYFNNVKSPAFTVNNNQRITATIPGTGAGYTKGYIKLSGFRGMEGLSKSIYQPVLKITGVNLISGGVDEDVALSGIFDPDFLYPENGGYRVGFGNYYSTFYRTGNFTLTGLIPTGSFGSAAPAMYEPDGVGKYPPFTGNFLQIAKPIIEGLSEYANSYRDSFPIKQFQRKDLVIYGKNFNYFFNQPYYIYASGGSVSAPDQLYIFDEFERNSDGTRLIVKNVRITGAGQSNQNFLLYVRNAGGTSSEHFLITTQYAGDGSPEDFTAISTINSSVNSLLAAFYYGQPVPGSNYLIPASNAIDNNNSSYMMVGPFGGVATAASGWVELTFNNRINFGAAYLRQSVHLTNVVPSTQGYTYYLFDSTSPFLSFDPTWALANTGILQCFDVDNNIVLTTGINYNTNFILPDDKIVTGVKRMKFYRNDTLPRFLGWSEISIYD